MSHKTLAPGSLATHKGRPVTILAQVDTRTYYIPGFHFWTAGYTADFTPADRGEIG